MWGCRVVWMLLSRWISIRGIVVCAGLGLEDGVVFFFNLFFFSFCNTHANLFMLVWIGLLDTLLMHNS